MPVEEGVAFFNKLGEIPVLNDGWYAASDYYSKVKDYNSVMKMTLSMAESGVKVAGQLSTPVLNRCQPQVMSLDGFACKTLESLETKYPVIKQPTEQLKETCSDYIEPVVGRVKPVISQVQGIVDSGKQRINGIKTASTNIMEEARNRGVGTVTHVVNVTFETAPGRFVTRTVDVILDVADNIVDKYLPEEKKEDEKDDVSDCSSTSEVEEMEEMDPTPKRVLVHASCIAGKLHKRVFLRAVKDITYTRARALTALKRMTNTVELMDLAKSNLNAAKEKIDHIRKEIAKDIDAADVKNIFVGNFEDRIIALGRVVARQVKSGVTAFEKAYSELGEFSRNPISKSKEYKELIATFLSVESFSNMSSQSVKEYLEFLQTRVKNIANISPNLNWVAMDIDMEDMPINETDLGMEQVMSTNNNSEDELEREENR